MKLGDKRTLLSKNEFRSSGTPINQFTWCTNRKGLHGVLIERAQVNLSLKDLTILCLHLLDGFLFSNSYLINFLVIKSDYGISPLNVEGKRCMHWRNYRLKVWTINKE